MFLSQSRGQSLAGGGGAALSAMDAEVQKGLACHILGMLVALDQRVGRRLKQDLTAPVLTDLLRPDPQHKMNMKRLFINVRVHFEQLTVREVLMQKCEHAVHELPDPLLIPFFDPGPAKPVLVDCQDALSQRAFLRELPRVDQAPLLEYPS